MTDIASLISDLIAANTRENLGFAGGFVLKEKRAETALATPCSTLTRVPCRERIEQAMSHLSLYPRAAQGEHFRNGRGVY